MALGSRFNPGGLFRCCVQTIIEDEGPEDVGRRINCKWCFAPLVVGNEYGYPEWRWDREADVTIECIRESIKRVPDDAD